MKANASMVLELQGICRSFGQVRANDQVDLGVARGTIHALVGENGAGKSTLMRVAYGELRADAGKIFIKGEAIELKRHSPALAILRGLGMVHQHFMLVKNLSVIENVVLGREPNRLGLLKLEGAAKQLRDLSYRFGLDLDPHAIIENLSVGLQQRVEIIKVLWQGCDVLILDEPTAVLTPQEARQLFSVLRSLVQQGMTVVLITHKLDEVCAIADRVTVMRHGKVVQEMDGRSASPESIAQAMVGRPVLLEIERPKPLPRSNEVILQVDHLHVSSAQGVEAVSDVSFVVHPGEIVGIAGVEGNGQGELVEALAGLRTCSVGRITLAGRDITHCSVQERAAIGLAHIPEDRQQRGLILDFTLEENLFLGRQAEFAGRLGLHRPLIREQALQRIAEADIRPPDPAAFAASLSGGNQQKTVVARELHRPSARLLLCSQPTRGVDIGAIEHIHRQLLSVREKGWGVLLVSAELHELTALSDRILVMYRGQLACELGPDEIVTADSIERIGAAMTGAKDKIA